MKTDYVIDGNEACAMGAYLFSEVCGIYPITPASTMASLVDKWSTNGKKNLFDDRVKVVEMQSEAGAAALTHGSLQSGSLSTTFTASQGLLLMIPSMYKIAGEMLPCVIHVAARSLATHALSIFGDHQDIYSTRSTGFCILSSSSVLDSYYMSVISHLSSISSSLPFLHFFDGFRTSHEINKVSLINEDYIKDLIPFNKISEFRNRALNIDKAITRGTSQTADVYFQNTESRNKYYMSIPSIVEDYMNKINSLAGTSYKPFEYYGSENAKYVIIAMGSVVNTIKLVVDYLNNLGKDVGVINVYLYRPFSAEYLLNVLPKSVKKIAVLDRTKEAGSLYEPLCLDVMGALKDTNVKIYGGRYGLSSKDVTPSDINLVFENLYKAKPKDHFTIGINDDVTKFSLEGECINIDSLCNEVKVYGFGSDGMVGASKNFIKVLGSNKDTFVQGYFEYDSKKSGGVTISHLRISNKKIELPFFLTNPNFIVVSKDIYLNKYDVLKGAKKNSCLLINSTLSDSELNDLINDYNKEIIINNNIKVYVCSLEELSNKYSLNGKINNVICNYMLKILYDDDKLINKFKSLVKKTYMSKGEDVVNNNINAIDESLEYLMIIDNNIFKLNNKHEAKKDIYSTMLSMKGDYLKVSDFIGHEDGTFDGGTSRSDKRKISSYVPKWKCENCIECNQCSFVCPHACIRPFSLTENDLLGYHINKSETIASLGEKGKGFYIAVNESNCTGCGLCIDACPSKNGIKALEFGKYDERLDRISEKLFDRHINDTPFNKYNVKGLGFEKPYFEFSGACSGCGEAGYIKVLTELYGRNIIISNATGCSSIYGGSLPNTPYLIPWMNSLFEDNAEFGYGLYTSYKNIRNKVKDLMFKYRNDVAPNVKNIFKTWIDNMDNDDITNAVKESLIDEELPRELRSLIDYIPSRNVWIIGGDGWAYDIGYGGLDHILYSNENVKILVLDTEVYSNTGGQRSKSTRNASVAEFSSSGKVESKKDLFKIAMNIPNVYVASISMGANMNQTIKAFKEATEHNGPSIIIAYSTCIEQGIKGGQTSSLKEQKLLVECGYNILMRYNPLSKELFIDSPEPDFDKYDEVFDKELRYKNLSKVNDDYENLYEQNKSYSIERYNYFKDIERLNKNER